MRTEFDPAKDASNRAKHGLSLSDFSGFDDEPIVNEDGRFDYGEKRFVALGRIEGRPHAVIYTRRGEVMRLIGFRRAHEKELRRHE
jgi:uncharacterized DUF497 family protein